MTIGQLGRMGLALAGIALAFAGGRVGVAFQRPASGTAPVPSYSGQQTLGNPRSQFDEPSVQLLDEKRSKTMNNERQRLMIRDADQLVQSAAELEVRVSNDPQGAAREDEGKRAETIEKLARSVKDRMRGMR